MKGGNNQQESGWSESHVGSYYMENVEVHGYTPA